MKTIAVSSANDVPKPQPSDKVYLYLKDTLVVTELRARNEAGDDVPLLGVRSDGQIVRYTYQDALLKKLGFQTEASQVRYNSGLITPGQPVIKSAN